MPYFLFLWTPEIEEHLAEHGVTPDEFERIVQVPESVERSRSSNRLVAYGESDDGRIVLCVYEMVDEMSIEPVTAYFLED